MADDAHAPDKSYVSIYKKFKAFVDETDDRQGKTDQQYLTVHNVSRYYELSVKFSKNAPRTVDRIRCGLQFYVNRAFQTQPSQIFTIQSVAGVELAILYHKFGFNSTILERDVDPHFRCPTDTLSYAENMQAMRCLFSHDRPYWRSLCMSWTLGNACFIRPDTFLKLRLSSIRADTRHRSPNDECTITYLLKPCDLKGGRNNGKGKTRVIGSWRHREPLLCAVGMLGFTLMIKLNEDLDDLTFYRGSPSRPAPKWWTMKLCGGDWSNTNVLGSQYLRFLRECQLSYCKCSYLRTSAIDWASFDMELTQDEITTMSKHTRNKFDIFYMGELSKVVLKVLAGFDRNEPYYIPRAAITFEDLCDDPLLLVFPKVDIWKSQHRAPNGDKGEACTNFLDVTLHYLATVILQDGVFFIHNFPQHHVSQYLRNLRSKIPFEVWAVSQRSKVATQVALRTTMQSSSPNALVVEKLTRIESLILSLHSSTVNSNTSVTVPPALQLTDTSTDLSSSSLIISTDRPSTTTLTEGHPSTSLATSSTDSSTSLVVYSNVDGVSSAANRIARPMVLRNTPIDQDVPTQLPKTVPQLLQQHETYRLNLLDGHRLIGWELKRRMAYLKRSYIYKQIQSRSIHYSESGCLKAALTMDSERETLGLTLDQYITYLKSKDPNCKQRNTKGKRQREDENEPPQ